MNTKHTPGPWTLNDVEPVGVAGREHWIYDSRGDLMLARVPQYAESYANARLIAAAPDLLAALRAMVELHEQRELLEGVYGDIRVDTARAAIAKAVQS